MWGVGADGGVKGGGRRCGCGSRVVPSLVQCAALRAAQRLQPLRRGERHRPSQGRVPPPTAATCSIKRTAQRGLASGAAHAPLFPQQGRAPPQLPPAHPASRAARPCPALLRRQGRARQPGRPAAGRPGRDPRRGAAPACRSCSSPRGPPGSGSPRLPQLGTHLRTGPCGCMGGWVEGQAARQ